LTLRRTRGYGSRPPVKRLLLPALALAAAACGSGSARNPAPLDRFYFPIGVATVPTASGTRLLVSSTNFDLLYDPASGGTLLTVDPASAAGPGHLGAGAVVGSLRTASFGGPLAIADKAACALPSTLALMASRYSDALYAMSVDDAGALACGAGCAVALDRTRNNPYGVTVACRPGAAPGAAGPAARHHAYVTYLRSPNGIPAISEVDLADPAAGRRDIALAVGVNGRKTYASAYDALTDRLWVTGQAVADAPIWAVDLAAPCDPSLDPKAIPKPPACPPYTEFDVYSAVRGAEPRAIALSTPGLTGPDPVTGAPIALPRRAYVTLRVYDPDLAASLGARPGFDVGAKLLVADVGEGPAGTPELRMARLVDLPLGADEVKVLSSRGPGRRDLVAVSCVLDGTVVLYDDDVGAIVRTFGASAGSAVDPATGRPVDSSHMPEGAPRTGRQPVGMALETRQEAAGPVDYLYVTSFLSDVVQVIRVDPADPAHADFVQTIGEIRPWP
jgi:hypothetical protein